ncbi:hypothetical protein GEMRC1_008476 [Eukaryota sp. GEM-RC1]
MSFTDLKAQGNTAFKAKSYEDAINYYTQALEVQEAKEVYSNRAAAYINLNQFQDALKDAESAIRVDPSFPKGYLRKSTALSSLGKVNEAKETLQEGLSHCSGNDALQQALSQLEQQSAAPQGQGMPDMASLFGNMFSPQNIAAVMADPQVKPLLNDPSFLQKLSQLQTNPNSFAQYLEDPAIQTFMTALISKMPGMDGMQAPPPQPPTTQPTQPPKPAEPKKEEEKKGPEEGTPEWYFEQEKSKGIECYKKRQFDEAALHFTKALEHLPNDVLIRLNLASVALEKGALEDCLRICDEALEKAKETEQFGLVWKCYFKKANALSRFERFPEAIEMYEKTLTEKRDRDVSLKLRDTKKKYQEWKQKQLINPEKSAEVKLEANEFFKQGKWTEAIDKYSDAIKYNPEDHTLYSNRAAAFIKIMQWDLALKDCDKTLELAPDFIRAYLRRAQINFFLKRYHRCIEDYERVLHLDNANADAITGLQQTQSAVYERQRQPPDQAEIAKILEEDSEIRKIFEDPALQQILQQIQDNPSALQKHMENPGFKERIQKLVQAGVLRMA